MEDKLFDIDGLLKRTMNDREIAKEILECFLEEAPTLINDICSGVKDIDYIFTREKSHELKGSCASVGAIKLQSISSQIQVGSESEDLEQITLLIDQLRICYDRTKISIISTGIVD